MQFRVSKFKYVVKGVKKLPVDLFYFSGTHKLLTTHTEVDVVVQPSVYTWGPAVCRYQSWIYGQPYADWTGHSVGLVTWLHPGPASWPGDWNMYMLL